MNTTILGKDIPATDAIKDYVDKKMERLVKYFGEDFDVSVTFRSERNEQIAEIIVQLEDLIKGFTTQPITIENLGKKRLAYEIRQNNEGIYLLTRFFAKIPVISELERFYRLNEKVLKFLTVKED